MADTSAERDRVVTARSLSQAFGPVRALDAVEITIRPGRVHALVGENGAGKSTLAKVLAGIQRPDAGAMTIGDAVYAPRDRAEAKARGVNMVPQQLSLVGELTLVENLLLAGPSRLTRRGEARALLTATLDRAGVRVDLDSPTASLSQAHRQLGEIVVALAEGARTLILDEPTSSLGPLEVGGLFEHLRGLCAAGTALVLITHRLDEVRQIADDVTVLSHGRMVHHGPARGLEPQRIARLMVGDLPAPPPRTLREPGDVVLTARGIGASPVHGSALEGIDLDLRAGEIVGLAGVAGSGQNLLLDILGGFVAPDAGTITVDGAPAPTAVELLRAGVAWLPEERDDVVVPTLTVGENLAVYDNAAGFRGRAGGRTARRATDPAAILRAFDVRPARPALMASGLSGGNQQKLLAARELGLAWEQEGTPRIVLAYGPTQGLDLRAAQALRERLVGLAERGAAVLVASHDLDELLAVADRLLVMFAGRIVDDLPIADATTDRLGEAMAGLPGTPAAAAPPPAAAGALPEGSTR